MIDNNLLQEVQRISNNLPKSGPRYTSYPTVPEWSTWGHEEYEMEISRFTGPEYSLYLHFPYCKTKCLFCACNAYVSNNQSKRDEYLDALHQEMLMHRKFLSPYSIKHLHLGGGTPTYISNEQLQFILRNLHDNYQFTKNCEKSVEIDPRTISKDKMRTLKNFQFNRVSFGVQDFDPTVQKFIRRQHSPEEILSIVQLTREIGIQDVNIDLIYGLNYQTKNTWEQTLIDTLKLRPQRVAAYSFANVPWKKKHQLGLKEGLVTPEEKLELSFITRDFFISNGYIAIGMDHYALPTDKLAIAKESHQLYRNFMGYTDEYHGTYFGFGCSSIGWSKDAFYQNISSPTDYQNMINSGKFATVKGCHLTDEDKIRQHIIQEIMNYGEINYQQINESFNINFINKFSEEISNLKSSLSELTIFTEKGFKLNQKGEYFTRNIAMAFDQYLNAQKSSQFSSTV